MPRANRHHLPGCIWHLTHRCHRREFLLTFAREASVGSGLAAGSVRDPVWTAAVAVGDRPYLERIARGLGMVARHREVEEGRHGFALREAPASYVARSEAEMPALSPENTLPWRIMR